MGYDLEDSTVVITGATGGLGRAVTGAYLDAGAHVVAVARSKPTERNHGSNLRLVQVDVLDEASVADLFSRVPAVTALVNLVGGYSAGRPVSELDLATFEGQLDINLKSAFLLTKHALRAILPNGGGKIVHVASREAVRSGRNAFAYSASKQGLVRLVEAVAAENRANGININCVLPGTIDTPANRAAMPTAEPSNWVRPEEIAKVIMFLTSLDSDPISGAAIPVYGKS